MAKKQYPTQERLKELFDYDPEGFLVWRRRDDIPSNVNARLEGSVAGNMRRQNDISFVYTVTINRKKYSCKDLIWIYFNGEVPEGMKILRKSAYLGFSVENLYLGSINEGTKYTPAKKRTSKQIYQGVTEIKNSGLFRVWEGEKPITFSSEIDAAVYYDNCQEKKSYYRPNETEKRQVEPIDNSTVRHLVQARKKKNKGGLVGVFADARGVKKPYYARIGSNKSGTMISLGYFETKEQAARAYNRAAREKYGEHAVLNDIPDPLGEGAPI